MDESEKTQRIIEARMKLKARFEEKIKYSPSMADDKPLGTGIPNRHGMPVLPIGQTPTHKWPVLDLGIVPEVSAPSWALTIDGAVDHPLHLTWADFMALPQTDDVSDFHCVT